MKEEKDSVYFPSEKGIPMAVLFGGFILFIVLVYIFGGEPFGYQIITYNSLFGYIISALMVALLLWIWFGTGYYVHEKQLKITFGPFKWSIDPKQIKKISKEKSPVTAPALSNNRLAIYYKTYKVISVSPKNREAFIQRLKDTNANIVVEDI
ncbi:PH domain-containing protein [Halobacillus litoralis]|uniref:PH domain-containing protein n=1 Tax=Halobacillus litoralis TaxID=45668 RepID=UPI001CD744AC|nr:PH domain-containing protein [Halobacillus litoralis]MCA0970502.1 PH domain-containing protein [Halobacillus litoralis]